MDEQAVRARLAQQLIKEIETAKKLFQPGLWYAATIIDPSIIEEEEDMSLVTIVATVELNPASDIQLIKEDLMKVLKTHGATLPESQWIPDSDTIADAYDTESVEIEILNP